MADVDRFVATQFGAGVEELITQLQRLGLQWTLRNATVTAYGANVIDATNVQGIYDGDTTAIRMISLVGAPPVEARVAVVFVPPAGNYIIGFINHIVGSSVIGLNTVGPSAGESTTLGTYTNLVSPASVEYTKQHSNTQLSVDLRVTLYSSAVSTMVMFGVSVNSVDYDITQFFINPSFTHVTVTAVRLLPDVSAGAKDVRVRWRRTSGTGALTRDVNDWLSLVVSEVN